MSPDETLIRQYFSWINERKLSDAASLFAPDAIVMQVPHRAVARGGAGFLQLAGPWLAAFPDATVTVERVSIRGGRTYEAHLESTGTHRGALDLGSLIFQPTGNVVNLNFRELLELVDNRITYSSLTYDLQQIVERLVVVDTPRVLAHLDRIRREGDRLAAAQDDPVRAREIVERLGLEIDAARHAVRPYFKH